MAFLISRFVFVSLLILSFSVLPSDSLAAISTDSLVGYWKLDETTAGSSADSSGHNNTGTGVGATGTNNKPQPTTEKPSLSFTNTRAVDFDGVDDYFDLGSNSSLAMGTGNFTIAAWFKAVNGAGSSYVYIRGKTQAGGKRYALFITSGNKLAGTVDDDALAALNIISTDNVDDDVWHHGVFVRSGDTLKLYLDGESAATDVTGADSRGSLDQGVATIGIAQNAVTSVFNDSPFDGQIDDVRVYNRVLSDGEIADLAAGTHPEAVWDGSSSTNYETAANWDINAIPDPYTNIVIPDVTNDPALTANASSSAVTINSGASLDLAGFALVLNDSGTFTNNGTFKLQGGETVTGISTVAATTTYTATSGTRDLKNWTYTNLHINGSGGTFTVPASLPTVGGIMTVEAGTLSANGQAVTVTGETRLSGGTYLSSTALQTLNGGLVISGGTLTGSSGTVDVNGGLTLSSGTLTAPSGNLQVSGDFDHAGGTFTHSSGTVILDGTSQSILGSSTFYNLTKAITAVARTLTFGDDTTQTIAAGGTLTLTGESGALLSLRTQSDNGTAKANINDGGTEVINYVNVKDNVATNSITPTNSVSAGGNTNWLFGLTISGTVYTNEGETTNVGSGVTVGLSVNGGAKTTVDTTSGGAFEFSAITVSADDTITLFLDDEASEAVLVTQAVDDSTDLTGLKLYTNKIVLRHETAGPMTNTLLAAADGSADDDLHYTISGSDVTFDSGFEVWLPSGETYTPGGVTDFNGSLEAVGTAAFNAAANAINIAGNWTASSTATMTTSGTVTFDGTDQTLITGGTGTGNDFQTLTKSGAGTLTIAGYALDVDGTLTISSGSTLDLNGQNFTANTLDNSNIFRLQGDETVTISTFDTNSGTTTYDGTGTYGSGLMAGDAYYHLHFTGVGTWTLDAPLDVDGNLTLEAGTLDVSTDSHGLTLAGDWRNTGGAFTERAGTVTFNGSGAQALTGETFASLTINNSAGTPGDDADVDSSAAVTVTGTLTVTDGQFQPTTGSDLVTVSIGANGILKPDSGANLTVSGAWTNDGTVPASAFVANAGTVTLDGTNQAINGDNTFYNLTKVEGENNTTDETLTFEAGSTQTITNTWMLDGRDDDDRINLRSSSQGTQWDVDPQGTRTLDYLDVQDSNNTNGTQISTAGFNIIQTAPTNNTNWLFGITISGVVYTNEAESANVGAGVTVGLSVNGAAKTTDATDSSGAFEFTAVSVSTNDTLTLFVDDHVTYEGVLVTQTNDNTTAITGLKLYDDKVVLRHESAGPMTNTLLATADGSADDDLHYTISGSDVTFDTGYELWLPTGETYTPGGTVGLTDFEVVGTGTFNPAANAVTVGGNWAASSTAAVTTSGTVTFNKSSGTQTLVSGGTDASHDFQNLTHSGAGTLQLSGYGLDVDGTLSNSAGVLDINGQNLAVTTTFSNDSYFQLEGGETVSATFDTNSGTTTYDGVSSYTTALAGGNSYYHLQFNGSGGTWEPNGTVTVSGDLTTTAGTYNADGQTTTVTGTTRLNGGVYQSSTATQTLNGGLTIAGGTLTGSSGTVATTNLTLSSGTLTAPTSLTISGDWTKSGGTFTPGAGTVTFNGSLAQAVTGATTWNNLTINNSAASPSDSVDVDPTAAQTVGGTLTVTDGQWTPFTSDDYVAVSIGAAGILKPDASAAITVAGDWANVGTFTHNSSTVTFDGAAAQSLTGDTFYNLTIANTAGSPGDAADVDSSAAVTVANTLTVSDGQFQPTTASSFATVTIGSDGILKPDSGATINVAGNWTNSGTFTPNSGSVEFTKTSATQTLNSGSSSFYQLTHSGAGTLQLTTNDLDLNNTFVNSDGIFDANGLDLSFGGHWSNTGDAVFTPGAGDIIFDGTTTLTDSSTAASNLGSLDITGTVTLATDATVTTVDGAGTLNLGAGSYSLTITGTGSPLGVTTFNPGTGSTVIYTSSGTDTTIRDVSYVNLTLTPTLATTFSLADDLIGANAVTGTTTINNLATLDAVTMIISSQDLTTAHLDIVAGGTYVARGSTITVSGNWSNDGTFTAGSSEVVLSGSNQRLTGSTTFYDLTKSVVAADTLTFAAGDTQTITDVLTLNGATGQLLTLASSIPGTVWNIDPQGTRTISYVDVSDSVNLNATAIDCVDQNCTNSGGNTNWTFIAPVVPEGTNNSGSSGGGSRRGGLASDFIQNNLAGLVGLLTNLSGQLIPDFLWPDTPVAVDPLPILVDPETVPVAPPPVLTATWNLNLLSSLVLDTFVLAPLPEDISVLAQKFPAFDHLLNTVGITKLTDVDELENTRLQLPGFNKISQLPNGTISPGQFSLPSGIPLADLPVEFKSQIPSEIVFTRGLGLVDFNINLNIDKRGDVEQSIGSVTGTPLRLVVKPEAVAKSVQGYLLLKQVTSHSQQLSAVSLNHLVASPFFAGPLTKKLAPETEPEIEERLVIEQFDYTDTDGDGLYTADILSPLVSGEYEVLTVIDYESVDLGKKELRLTTVIDPEGYVYEKIGDKELRIPNAIVSLNWLNPDTTSYELWPAENFQQTNPQVTDVRGTYSFLVPEGTYALRVEAPSYDSYEGKAFVVKSGNGVHVNIELESGRAWWRQTLDWRTILLVAVVMFLAFKFYRDKIKKNR